MLQYLRKGLMVERTEDKCVRPVFKKRVNYLVLVAYRKFENPKSVTPFSVFNFSEFA